MLKVVDESENNNKNKQKAGANQNKEADFYYVINQCRGMSKEVLKHREEIEKIKTDVLHNTIELDKVLTKLKKLIELSETSKE